MTNKRSSNKRKTPTDYHALAKKRGFKWLGPEVPNTKSKTTWQCKKGHQWQAIYGNIKQNKGCPLCVNYRSKTPQDYHTLATKRGFKWLGPEVPNARTKTTWQCSKGHQWQTRYDSVKEGKNCFICGHGIKLPSDYHALAEKRGFKWLGPMVSKVTIKTNWQCSNGHQWQAVYNKIQQGRGCPFCSKLAPKVPQDYHILAKKRGFKWLGPMVSKVTIKTSWQCSQGHQWQAVYNAIQNGNGCPVCSGNIPKTPADYHHLAQKRGFRWLGPQVPNTKTKTTWQCSKGHQWQTPYGYILQGSGCHVCNNSIPKRPLDYHALAKKRGFKWLGPEVPNVATKTTWQCHKGHQWQAIYSNISQGCGCPVCSNHVPKTPQDYHNLAEKRGFKWLGPEVPTTQVKTEWQCEQGHYWKTTYGCIQQGKGCRECYLETIRKRRKKRKNKPTFSTSSHQN